MRHPAGWLALVLLLGGPGAGAAPRTAMEVTASQLAFDAAGTQLRKRLALRSDLGERGTERLAEIQFVYERSALPSVRIDERAGVPQVVVSDGWAALVQSLLQAEALGVPACWQAFAHAVLPVARANQLRARESLRPRLLALPGLEDFLTQAQHQPGHACRGLLPQTLQRPDVRAAVTAGMDASWSWLLGRQLALLLPDPGMATAACADRDADRRGAELAASAGQTGLARAGPAVLAHSWLMTAGGARRACISGPERLRGHAARFLTNAESAALLSAWPR